MMIVVELGGDRVRVWVSLWKP